MRKVDADDNPLMDCAQLDTFDFRLWRDSGPHYVSVYSQKQTAVRVVPSEAEASGRPRMAEKPMK